MRAKYLNNFRKARQVACFKSYKNGRTMWAESELERNTQRYYEYQADVYSFKEQPKQYAYIDENGEKRSNTPDLLLQTVHGEELKETKPDIFTHSDRAVKRFNHLRMCFHKAKNLNLSYITDKEVYAGSTTENLKRIHHYRRLNISNINLTEVVKAIGEQPSFGALKQYVQSTGLQVKHALALLGHQVFRFDYKESLSDSTSLTFAGE